MRGATRRLSGNGMAGYISIHAPHARSDSRSTSLQHQYRISIHAPHARSDYASAVVIVVQHRFQSTLLMRGATYTGLTVLIIYIYFNPRSSCEERLHRRGASAADGYFNPRSSCEERRAEGSYPRGSRAFQSTLLMRGATPAPR